MVIKSRFPILLTGLNRNFAKKEALFSKRLNSFKKFIVWGIFTRSRVNLKFSEW